MSYKIATIYVSGTEAKAVGRQPIPAGIVGAYVEIRYTDPMWAALLRKVTFEGAVVRDVLNNGTFVEFPKEVATQYNVNVRIGITGSNADKGLVIPTFWADLGTVQKSAQGNHPQPEASEIPLWAQVEGMVGDIENLKTEKKTDLVAAVNELHGKIGDNSDLTKKMDDVLVDIADLKRFHPIEVKSVTNNVGTVEPGIYYQFGEVDSLAVTLVEKDADLAHEYLFEFVPSEDFSGLTITPEPQWIGDPQYPTGKRCIVSVQLGLAVMGCG